MNLVELGSIVEKKRQSKNLSLDDVAQATKIPKKSLIALEHGDLEFIGYETYYKNFLKCYALYLGYTLDEYLELIKNVEDFSDQVLPPKSLEAQHAEKQPEMTKPRGRKLAVQLFVLAVIGGSAYFYFTNKDSFTFLNGDGETVIEEKAAEPQKTEFSEAEETFSVKTSDTVRQENAESSVTEAKPEQKAVKPEETADAKKTEETKADTAKEEQKPAVEQKTEQKAAEETEKEQQEEAVVQKMPEDKPQEPAFDMQAFLKANPSAKVIDWTKVEAPQNGYQQAVMHAKQDCWMQYSQDGKSGHFILKKGEQRVFNFKKSLSFKIANGSAITLFHNKKPVQVGDSQKVREINLK